LRVGNDFNEALTEVLLLDSHMVPSALLIQKGFWGTNRLWRNFCPLKVRPLWIFTD
jgi:hypothetical protein